MPAKPKSPTKTTPKTAKIAKASQPTKADKLAKTAVKPVAKVEAPEPIEPDVEIEDEDEADDTEAIVETDAPVDAADIEIPLPTPVSVTTQPQNSQAIVIKENLQAAITLVKEAVATRSTLPVLGNIKLEFSATNGLLTLSATNLEIGIITHIGAKGEADWALTVPHKVLADTLSVLPNEPVTLTCYGKTATLQVKCADYLTSINGLDADEFPVIQPKSIHRGELVLGAATLKAALNRTIYATATDEARPILMGVSLTVKSNDLELAASDGFRIAATTGLQAQISDIAVIIPAKICGLLSKSVADGEVLVQLFNHRPSGLFDKDQTPAAPTGISFEFTASAGHPVTFVSQLIEGKFPDFKAVTPSEWKTRLVTTIEQLTLACKAAQVFAKEAANTMRLSLVRDEARMGLNTDAVASEVGSNKTFVPASIDGELLDIAVNVKYLRDTLDSFGSGNVVLEMTSPTRPIKAYRDNDNGPIQTVAVIMPMHLGR